MTPTNLTPTNQQKRRTGETQFVLVGFVHHEGFRVFSFERREEDHGRTIFTVQTDLNLIKRYGIPLQELPSACRTILERRQHGENRRSLIFGEDEIRIYAEQAAAARIASSQRKKTPKKPPSENVGNAWRSRPLS